MHLADSIGEFLGKVEIVLAGADDDLRDGEDALASGDPMGARLAARRVLERAPHSPLGLALLADACEAARLDAELAQTLEELALRAPSRAEVWARLARARRATGGANEEVRDAFVRALAVAEPGTEPRREALLELADLDLAQGNAARAELWLDRAADDGSQEVLLRRAEARLLRADPAGARKLLDDVHEIPTDGRTALARGRALAMLGNTNAFAPLLRAMVLDVPGASEALASALAHVSNDPQLRARIRSVVDAKGEHGLPRWRAAFARAEGARDAARSVLGDAVRAGDRASVRALLDAAIEDRDLEALKAACQALDPGEADSLFVDAGRIAAGTPDDVARISDPRLLAWAEEVVEALAIAWFPDAGAPADWPAALSRLDEHARSLGDSESIALLADLSAERSRPVRLAIIGEFNAGKSTFINALIGSDVAPTGILPTTATLHHLRWAPDPIARIFFLPGHEPTERIVPLTDVRGILASLDTTSIRRIELLMPLPFLVRVEILDTPGFNAPNRAHAKIARSVFEEADAAIWLLDGTQALKQSERAVLDEAREARLPLQILVNKADRLRADDLAVVMDAVREALEGARIATLAPPLALSAKKALAGKLGDVRALEESGWFAAQALLDERIVACSDSLKERALRRRASRIVGQLASRANESAALQREDAEARAARAHAVSLAAATMEDNLESLARTLVEDLRPSAETWERDLALVYVGRDRASALRDPALARYRTDRALEALAPALARSLASLAPEACLTAGELAPLARALVRAATSASSRPRSGTADGMTTEGGVVKRRDAPSSTRDVEELLDALGKAAPPTLIDHLFSLSVVRAPTGSAAGILRELQALTRVLDRTSRV